MAQKGAAELVFRGRREQKAAFPPWRTMERTFFLLCYLKKQKNVLTTPPVSQPQTTAAQCATVHSTHAPRAPRYPPAPSPSPVHAGPGTASASAAGRRTRRRTKRADAPPPPQKHIPCWSVALGCPWCLCTPKNPPSLLCMHPSRCTARACAAPSRLLDNRSAPLGCSRCARRARVSSPFPIDSHISSRSPPRQRRDPPPA